MADSTIWWLLAGSAVVIELVTGTFYILMLAIGLAAAAVAASVGVTTPVQLVTAAVVGSGALAAWHVWRGRQPPGPTISANQDVNMDVGGTVQVDAWHADGTATVRYRGANWTVAPLAGIIAGSGPHRVREVVGSRLIVEKISPS